MRKTLRVILAMLLSATLLHPAISFASSVYQIEVVIFGRSTAVDEHSATGAGLRYPQRITTLQSSAVDATSVGSFQLLPASVRNLDNEADALSKRGYPILFHGAWRQGVQSASSATSAALSGGRSAGAYHELEGYVTLSAESYLHIDVNLWLSKFVTAAEAGATETPVLPVLPGTLTDITTSNTPSNAISNTVISKLYVLQQQRKIRSGELHYFDHPRFSALILVKPVE